MVTKKKKSSRGRNMTKAAMSKAAKKGWETRRRNGVAMAKAKGRRPVSDSDESYEDRMEERQGKAKGGGKRRKPAGSGGKTTYKPKNKSRKGLPKTDLRYSKTKNRKGRPAAQPKRRSRKGG
ncbi:hypothetical protein GR11A_00060 [Vibrio phage vB_VcorM_GR11A]|nr:hypothetical protein GR11A_00060 [Vibrio phage vB_VcorM_GR11A]